MKRIKGSLYQEQYTLWISVLFSVLTLFFTGCNNSSGIKVQQMTMQLPPGNQKFSEQLLTGEMSDMQIEHVVYAGPMSEAIQLSGANTDMFVFIKGNGEFQADSLTFGAVPESLAIPFSSHNITIQVKEGDTLHFVRFSKKMTLQDIEERKMFPPENKYDVYFRKFIDCEPYTEKIKSPKTVSRTVLPADIVPRVSLGTVQTTGPDEVGAHKHPMLDQLFMGLAGNNITVHADKKTAELKEYSILHIPVGSGHWASVDNGNKMYYLWMDFFFTREGQEWLKTHKPISIEKKK